MVSRAGSRSNSPTIGEALVAIRDSRHPCITFRHKCFLTISLATRLPHIQATIAEMSHECSMSERQIRRLLGDLIRWGMVRRERGKNPNHDPWICFLDLRALAEPQPQARADLEH